MKNMKICAVTTWPPHRDGVALYSAYLYGHMSKNAGINEIIILANKSDSSAPFKINLEKDRCKVVRCWRRGSFLYPFKIFRDVLKENPNIIHLQHGWLLYGDKIHALLFPALLFFLRLLHKPVIVTIHTVVRRKARLYNNRIVNFMAKIAIIFLTRTIVKLSDRVIVHNHLMKKILEESYSLKKEEKKIFVVPHGVKEILKKPMENTRENGAIQILSLGFIRKKSGIEYLIEAFKSFSANYPNTTLVIVGGRHAHDKEDYTEAIKRILANSPKNIVFTDFIDEEKLDELIWKSEIVVLSAVEDCYIEASGSLARVAMYGKPVICNRVPKFEIELKDGEDCIMTKPKDKGSLMKALTLLFKDAKLRERLGCKLKEKFRGKCWSNVAKRHLELFKSVSTRRQRWNNF